MYLKAPMCWRKEKRFEVLVSTRVCLWPSRRTENNSGQFHESTNWSNSYRTMRLIRSGERKLVLKIQLNGFEVALSCIFNEYSTRVAASWNFSHLKWIKSWRKVATLRIYHNSSIQIDVLAPHRKKIEAITSREQFNKHFSVPVTWIVETWSRL